MFGEGFETWDHFEVDGRGLWFERKHALVILIAPDFYACFFLEIDTKGILLDGTNLIELEEKQGLFGGDIEACPCFSCVGAVRGIVCLVGGCVWCVAAATFAEVDANPKDTAQEQNADNGKDPKDEPGWLLCIAFGGTRDGVFTWGFLSAGWGRGVSWALRRGMLALGCCLDFGKSFIIRAIHGGGAVVFIDELVEH